MQKTLFIKLSIIASLCIIFAIGLSMIQSLIYERQDYAHSVITDIAKQHVYPQQLLTPFILTSDMVLEPCEAAAKKTSDSEQSAVINNHCTSKRFTYAPILAQQTKSAIDLAVSDDTYKRGIYHATSYQGQLFIQQTYQSQALKDWQNKMDKRPSQLPEHTKTNDTTKPILVIPVSDLRGVRQLPSVSINGKHYVANYPEQSVLPGLNYIEVVLDNTIINRLHDQPDIKVTIDLPIAGISHLQVIPLGQAFDLTMNSDWQTPNFIGDALPTEKTLNNDGFHANWQNQYLAIGNNQKLSQCLMLKPKDCTLNHLMGQISVVSDASKDTYTSDTMAYQNSSDAFANFSVSFAQPNNAYLQTERTIKYALLLILVSFATFFLFEVIKALRIHPIQYLLVGCALLVFYVLLLSLSEYVAFWQAYLAASIACVSLIGWYAYYVLHSVYRALLFTAILSGLYAGFYGILTVADMNLLLGALFCFVLVASVMIITRKIDWYNIT